MSESPECTFLKDSCLPTFTKTSVDLAKGAVQITKQGPDPVVVVDVKSYHETVGASSKSQDNINTCATLCKEKSCDQDSHTQCDLCNVARNDKLTDADASKSLDTDNSSHIPVASEVSTSAMPVINIICPIGDKDSIYDKSEYEDPVSEQSSSFEQHKELESSSIAEIDAKIADDRLSKNDESSIEFEDPDKYLANVGENLVPGCVAPAPTPVPILAPLAEDEIYSADDEKLSLQEEDNAKSIKSASEQEELSSEDKQHDATDDRNSICPWEDE